MVEKKLIKHLILLSIIVAFLFSLGCNGQKAAQEEKENSGDEKQNIITEAVTKEKIPELPTQETIKEEPLETTESNKESIDDILNKQRDVYEVKWSYDNMFVAFVKGDPDFMEGQLFLWKVGEKKPIIVESLNDRICEIIWSPDSKYAFVDIGTSALRAGYIVEAKECKIGKSFTYTGNSQWSPDSKWVAIGMESTIQPITPTELNGVVDLVIYNVKTGEKKIIAKATSEYDYTPRSWDEDGILHYEKYYYTDRDISEKLTFIYKQDG